MPRHTLSDVHALSYLAPTSSADISPVSCKDEISKHTFVPARPLTRVQQQKNGGPLKAAMRDDWKAHLKAEARSKAKAASSEREAVAGFLARVEAWDTHRHRIHKQEHHRKVWEAVRDWDAQRDENEKLEQRKRRDDWQWDAYHEPPKWPEDKRITFQDEGRVNGRKGRGYVPPCECAEQLDTAGAARASSPPPPTAKERRNVEVVSPPPPARATHGVPHTRRRTRQPQFPPPPRRHARDAQLAELKAAQAEAVASSNARGVVRGCVQDMQRMPSKPQSLAGVPRMAHGDIEEEKQRLGHALEFDFQEGADPQEALYLQRQRRARLQSADAIQRAAPLAHLRVAGRKRNVAGATSKVVCW